MNNNARSTTVSLTIQFSYMICYVVCDNNITILVNHLNGCELSRDIRQYLPDIIRLSMQSYWILRAQHCYTIWSVSDNYIFNLGCVSKIRCNPHLLHVNSVRLADNQWLYDLCVCQMSIHWFWYNQWPYSAIQLILYSFRFKRIVAILTMYF